MRTSEIWGNARHTANTIERHYATQIQYFHSLPVEREAGLKESSAAHSLRSRHPHCGTGCGSAHKPFLSFSCGSGATLAKAAGIKFAFHCFDSAGDLDSKPFQFDCRIRLFQCEGVTPPADHNLVAGTVDASDVDE